MPSAPASTDTPRPSSQVRRLKMLFLAAELLLLSGWVLLNLLWARGQGRPTPGWVAPLAKYAAIILTVYAILVALEFYLGLRTSQHVAGESVDGNEPRLDKLQTLAEQKGISQVAIQQVRFSGTEFPAAATRHSGRATVLIDPILFRLLDDRELTVIATHELGHIRLGHLRWGLAKKVLPHVVAVVLTVVVVLPLVLPVTPWYVGAMLYLPLAALWFRLGMWGSRMGGRAVSRRQERHAGRWALEATGDPEAFLSAVMKWAKHIGATKPPAWWQRVFLADHPSLDEMIDQARRFARERGIPLAEPSPQETPNP